MDYQETINFLFNQLPAFERSGDTAYKPGLQTVNQLSHAFGNPHHKIKTIHVAGTNGKGSTSHTLASILQSAGYRVGLFTSPHLVDFRERIRVNGQMIPRHAVTNFIERYQKKKLGINPTFFELTTVMAFEYFADQKVDIAIIEVGLGGRLDSTNIITPILSIITNISLDHISLLGNSEPEIAREKAGIIKPGVPVIIGEADNSAVKTVFQEIATQNKAPIIFAKDVPEIKSIIKTGNGFNYITTNYGLIHGELGGNYQPMNSATTLCAVSQIKNLGFSISNEAIAQGFQNVCKLTGLAGRWMKLYDKPLAICDTGHNPGGWEIISKQIAAQPGKKHIIIGFVSDKDVDSILQLISDLSADSEFYFTAPHNHRRLDATELKIIADRYGLHGNVYQNVKDAYKKALAVAGKGDFVFVGGSNYLIAELLESLH